MTSNRPVAHQAVGLERVVDGLIIAHLLFVSLLAYGEGRRVMEWSITLTVMTQMVLISFVAALYDFRWPTRVFWSALMPLTVCLAVIMGALIRLRIEKPPGYTLESYYFSFVPIAFVAYLLPIPVWVALRRLGWSLRRDSHVMQRTERSVGLLELFALTGIVCFLLVMVRDAIPTEEMLGLLRYFMRSLPMALHTIPYCIVLVPCLWIGFHLSLGRAVLASVAWLLFACGINVLLWDLITAGGRQVAYLRLLSEYALGYGMLCVTIVIARLRGYSLMRTKASYS